MHFCTRVYEQVLTVLGAVLPIAFGPCNVGRATSGNLEVSVVYRLSSDAL